ncbi:MAG TPA: ATP-binding protein, partial [Polyangiaceae bacterium]|nr:ATP-binding protein [Polyangiaceae bacterium]
RLFHASVIIILRTADSEMETVPNLTPNETALLERTWTRGEFSTSAATDGYSVWVPLVGLRESLGVIGLKVTEPIDETSGHGLLLSACARELATALERLQLASAVHRSQLEAETERMRNSLLSAISHDLKTPLANIVAAGTTLLAHRADLEPSSLEELVSSIVGEGERLSRLVQNLLSITRLESSTIDLKRSPEAVEEIVAAALARLRPQVGTREIKVDLPSNLPWILAEPALIEQVLSNLLENALRYTPATSPIGVSGRVVEGGVGIQVADRGAGIPEQEWERVFEKFYRGSRAPKNDGGVGLGLTICRAIIRAHGGRIGIRGRDGGGTIVEFTLPVARGADAFREFPQGDHAQ